LSFLVSFHHWWILRLLIGAIQAREGTMPNRYSRRDFVTMAFAGLPLSVVLGGKIDSTVSGVRLGTITYSFRDMPRTPGAADGVDVMIKACADCGIGEIELFSPQLEPAQPSGRGRSAADVQQARDALRRWRLSTSI